MYITKWSINCLYMWYNQKDSAAEVHDNGLGEILRQTQSETLKKYY